MRIAIASGKGGTGKSTFATNLAAVAAEQNVRVTFADCDVEEPNGNLFLKLSLPKRQYVAMPIPEVDQASCDSCGDCSSFCQYNAIAVVPGQVIVFPELCHGCGGCKLICPRQAIREVNLSVGVIDSGEQDGLRVVQGCVEVGVARVTPIVQAVKSMVWDDKFVIIDAPPGTSCPVVEAVRDVDHVLLVTEPTPFGLHDLKLAVELLRTLLIPFSVIVNRAGIGDERVFEYCREEQIEICMELQDDRRIAETYSAGKLIVDALPEYKSFFEKLLQRIRELDPAFMHLP